jgi:flavodoxin
VKVLVSYFSQTGNTERVAKVICKAVQSQGHEGDLSPVSEIAADSLAGYDLVFLGSACHSADLAQPVKQLLTGIPSSPTYKLAGFVTHSTVMPEGGERERELHERWASKCVKSLNQASEEKGIDFLGYFSCQGAPSPPIEMFIHNTIVTDDDEWKVYIDEVKKHPTQDDLEKAKEFALGALSKC